MKNKIKTIFLFSLLACSPPTEKSAKKTESTFGIDTLSLKDTLQTHPDTTSETDPYADCVRGQATPIIKKTVFPKTTFQLQPDSTTAIETVDFKNGDKLIIKNWGCEYYVLTFRFETSRFQDDTTNIPFWFKKVVLLMYELENGIDSPINITKGYGALINHIDGDMYNNYENLKLGNEIDFGRDEIRSFVTVDRIEKLTEKKYAVEISFATGPL